ncbi:hypothetical protein L486_07235 [Kwoniella mangroviensis CBS 10435]|uniref:F-box domain-containing protein n=1 Tax=Kwoniella mangroviensis CBS 10435 TaxID=1331196 RepID=A0A1B9IIA2_9TREE|nr:hypothetical protein L486_07235 [Kwoniella mangroviensis CBS 10435]
MSYPINPYRITLASQKVAFTSDILQRIISFLPRESLFATLLTNRFFYGITAKILYGRIIISPPDQHDKIQPKEKAGDSDSDSSTDEDDMDMETDQERSTKITNPKSRSNPFIEMSPFTQHLSEEYTKSFLLSLTDRIDLYIHKEEECPNRRKTLTALPNLRVLHLAGGQQKNEYPEWEGGTWKNKFCKPLSCPFVSEVCTQTRCAIIRQLDFRPLKDMERLEEVIVRIRPCQIPDLRPSIPLEEARSREEYYYYFPTGPEQDQKNYNVDKVVLPPTVKRLKVIWWDEKHNFRIDWKYMEEYSGHCRRGPPHKRLCKDCVGCRPLEVDSKLGYRSRRFSERLMGSVYGRILAQSTDRDMEEERRQSKILREKLVDLISLLSKQGGLKHIEFVNFDKTAQMAIPVESRNELEIEKVKEEMKKAFLAGRKEQSTDSSNLHPLQTHEDIERSNADDIGIRYRSIHDYYPSGFTGIECDPIEEEYWQTRFNPGSELSELRAELGPLISDRLSNFREEELEFHSQKELKEELKRAKRRQGEQRILDDGGKICGPQYRGSFVVTCRR